MSKKNRISNYVKNVQYDSFIIELKCQSFVSSLRERKKIPVNMKKNASKSEYKKKYLYLQRKM